MANLIKVAIHLSNGELIHIQNAQNGLKCNCRCEKCGVRFQAIQDSENEWHFRHDNSDMNCDGAPETVRHLLAKQIYLKHKKIALPGIGMIEFLNPSLERVFQNMRPDVSAFYNDEEFFLEVVVSHPLSLDSRAFYIKINHKAVVINLINCSMDSYEKFEYDVIYETSNKEIIFWEPIEIMIPEGDLTKQLKESQVVFTPKPKKTIIEFILKYWYIFLSVFAFIVYRITKKEPVLKKKNFQKQRKKY